jgi:hypothetical protein
MRVHHLDCCTMCPRGQSAINGEGSLFARARLVSHCLLIETDAHGLVLVDTGIGVDDVRMMIRASGASERRPSRRHRSLSSL